MAIIYSYPTVTPEKTDLILGTDVSVPGKPTKNFTIQSVIDLVTIATGDLQFVLDLGFTAIGKDINLTNNTFRGGGFVTTSGGTITGTTASGFTNVTSTAFTGTIATPAQPNITSLGTLSALVISGPISGTGLITNSNLTGAQNDNVVSTLAIKTYVDNKVGLYDTLAEVLGQGNVTGGTDIAVSAGDDVTFTDTSKILMGTTPADNLEIYSDSANSIVIDRSPGALKLQTSLLSVRNEADTTQTISATAAGGVELYHVGAKKIETLTGGAKVTGAFEATTSGTFASLINTGSYSDSSGDVGTAGQILSSTGSGTNWVTEVPLYSWSLEGTAIPSGTAVTVTDGTNITTTWDATNFDLTIATTGVPDGSGAANQVTYWSDTDTLTGAAGFTFAGGATGQVTVAGILQAGTLSDGTFSGSAGTYTGGVSITSTDFVGALTGNADTATALASSGAIAITGDTTSTGGPYTYTSGGAISIATTIADTTVTGKVLTNLATPTSAAIAATDTILAAMAKLQGQINGIAGSLAFEGTWDASAGTAPSATPLNGQFWIVSVAGNTDLSGITDWLVGDWAIYVDNGAGTDAWQKLDQSNEVLGSGAANKIAKWTSTNTLATGLIADDGTTVTVGNSGNFIVEGNTTLGDADTDSTTVKGPAVFEETLRINEGISLGAATYGTAGQVLTSGGGSASVNTWTTPTTGTVTSVALTETGDALTITGSPITGSGTINIAGAGSASQYINGALDLVTFPTLDNYQYWVLSDGTNTTNITSTGTATFASGTGIINSEASGTITTAIDYVGTDNAIEAAADGTGITVAGTDKLWVSDADDNTIKQINVSQVSGVVDQSLSEVLAVGNTTGGTDIAVSAGDDITFTDTSKALFGTGNDLQIYHDGSNSYVAESGTGDLYIRGSNSVYIGNSAGTASYISGTDGGAVNLYYNGSKTFETTSTGINIDQPGNTYSRISLKGSGTTYGTVQGDSTNGLLLRSGGSSNQGLAINGYNSTFLGAWGGGVAGTVMKIEGFTPKVEIGDSTNFGNGNLTDLEVWGDVDVKGKITGSSSGVSSLAGRKFAYVSKALTVAGSWTDMFSLSGVFIGVISEVFGQCNVYGSITKSEALSYHVAQAGGSSGSVANTPVYNKIIDTGPGSAASFELQFLAYNASNNTHGYKCQARALTANSTVDISVNWMDSTVNSHTFVDLT